MQRTVGLGYRKMRGRRCPMCLDLSGIECETKKKKKPSFSCGTGGC